MSETGALAAARALAAHGTDLVFGVPGAYGLELFDALGQVLPADGLVVARHEQGAAFMADGYGRTAGRPGVCVLSAGPGVTNGLTALLSADHDWAPVLLLATQISTPHLGNPHGHVHELHDQLGLFREGSRWCRRLAPGDDVAAAVEDALAAARGAQGRPGLAVLELPDDVLAAPHVAAHPATGGATIVKRAVPSGASDAAVGLLQRSSRPVVVLGRGATGHAAADVAALAERLGAPVLATVPGKGGLDESHDLAVGNHWSDPDFRASFDPDVALVLGDELSPQTTNHGQLPLPASVIHVFPAAEPSFVPVEVVIDRPVGEACRDLLRELPAAPRSPWHETRRAVEMSRERQVRGSALACALVDAVEAETAQGGVVVVDLTVASYWFWQRLRVSPTRRLLSPFRFAPLGYALPAAIGAVMARPDVPVVAVCGDGGLLFTASELAVVRAVGARLVLVVVDDGRFGKTAETQQARYGRMTMTELTNPDIVSLAWSFGIHASRVGPAGELSDALAQAVASAPAVVVVSATLPTPGSRESRL